MVAAPPEPVVAHPQERELWGLVAEIISPRARVRPSEWAEANVVLGTEYSAKPGPVSFDWKPWSRDVIDADFDNPEKVGVIGIKPRQVGWSLSMNARLACFADTEPGPMLYVTTDQGKAGEFCESYFMPIVKRSPRLARLFAEAARDRSELKYHKPYVGGVIDFVGAGTEGGVISIGRRVVMLDEYQKSDENFPQASGDLFMNARESLRTFGATGLMFVFGHPRYEMEDIHRLYMLLSDMRRWVFDCPLAGCGRLVEPCWDRIDFRGIREELAEPDPAKAAFVCPHCAREITDGQRARAVWPPRLNGTGRFESSLPPEQGSARPFVGLALNRLADPDITVRALAEESVQCRTEESLQTFFNKGLGQVRKKTRAVVTLESIRACMDIRDGAPIVPGGELGVRFLAAGADVQSPRHQPTMYHVEVAYAADGAAYLTRAERASGWAAYQHLLRTGGVRVSDGRGNAGELLGISVAGIDAKWETGQVLDNCRDPLAIYSAADGRVVKRLPLAFVPQLHADNPAVMPPPIKRTKPGREDLGLLDYWYLHRHSWVDRVMRRIMEGRLKILCRVPEGFEAQLASNVLRPVAKQHGMDRDREEWVRPDEFRDDWLMALVYAEAAAVLELELDRIHAMALEPGAAAGPGSRTAEASPFERFEGWSGHAY